MMSFQTTVKQSVLDNGLRVLSESVPYVDSVSVGIWVDAGARDEHGKSCGIHHFIEHMLFKGTGRRTARQIADEMDLIGGHLNAFTDRETTWYYAKVLSEHTRTALDILSDMILHSVHDPEELARERNVVLEELIRHEDTPDDLIHDVFAQTIWPKHPIGNMVIGTRKAVSSFDRESVLEHIARDYTPNNIVISAAGNLQHEDLVALVEEFFGKMTGVHQPRKLVPAEARPATKISTKPVEQVQLCMGTKGYPHAHPDKYVLAVLDAVIGGSMSSRLFQEVRENRGLVYNIGSYSASYREAGLFTVYAGTSMENMQQVVDLVRKELELARNEAVGEEEAVRGRNQIRGALVLGQESMSNRMSRLANSVLYYGRIVPVQEVIDAIMKVTPEDMMRVANELFIEENIVFTAIGPFKRKRKAA